jgi:hypothetical protein
LTQVGDLVGGPRGEVQLLIELAELEIGRTATAGVFGLEDVVLIVDRNPEMRFLEIVPRREEVNRLLARNDRDVTLGVGILEIGVSQAGDKRVEIAQVPSTPNTCSSPDLIVIRPEQSPSALMSRSTLTASPRVRSPFTCTLSSDVMSAIAWLIIRMTGRSVNAESGAAALLP